MNFSNGIIFRMVIFFCVVSFVAGFGRYPSNAFTAEVLPTRAKIWPGRYGPLLMSTANSPKQNDHGAYLKYECSSCSFVYDESTG